MRIALLLAVAAIAVAGASVVGQAPPVRPLVEPSAGPAAGSAVAAEDPVAVARRQADLVDALQHRTFLYFVEQVNPENGLVKDRSTATSPASIAGTGFAIPVWAIGAERGWIPRERARDLTLALLRFLRDGVQSEAPDATGYRGLYYHFLDLQTGRRVWNCELSTIDTALLLAGVRFALQYYDGDDPVEAELRALAEELTRRVQWDWLTVAEGRFADSLALGWRPETGPIPVGWVGYNEALILYLLAAGSGFEGAPAAWRRWTEFYDWQAPYPGLELLAFPPLFGHQYSHAFVDFRGLQDAFMRERGTDYFENSRRAVQVQRRYAQDNPGGFVGYGEHLWGLTASDGPAMGGITERGGHTFDGYRARGTSGGELGLVDDGTIAPTAAAASIAFEPVAAIAAIVEMHDRFGDAGLWGPYGFKDAFNPTADWIASDYLAIDQAPIVLMIENWRSGFVWRYMMRDPVLRRGLEVLGFDEPAEHRFEAAVRALEARDVPADDAVLFVGSSSIVGWRDLATDMAPLAVINRGFGGSQASDVIHFFDRLTADCRPRAVVLYEGDNDIAAGSSPIEVLVRIREIARLLEARRPGTPLFVLAIKPSIARRHLWPEMQAANALLRDFCARRDGCVFVDITAPMLTEAGEIRTDIFKADKLHMNRTGYEEWAAVVAPLLHALPR